MLDGGCNWRNRLELLRVLMRWSLQLLPYQLWPNTTRGSKIFVLDGRDGSDAEYRCPLPCGTFSRERPRSRSAADERDELAASHHSITSSARASFSSCAREIYDGTSPHWHTVERAMQWNNLRRFVPTDWPSLLIVLGIIGSVITFFYHWASDIDVRARESRKPCALARSSSLFLGVE